MDNHVPELTAFELVKMYEKQGIKITVEQAQEELDFMDFLIKLVKKQLQTDENSRFIYQSKHR